MKFILTKRIIFAKESFWIKTFFNISIEINYLRLWHLCNTQYWKRRVYRLLWRRNHWYERRCKEATVTRKWQKLYLLHFSPKKEILVCLHGFDLRIYVARKTLEIGFLQSYNWPTFHHSNRYISLSVDKELKFLKFRQRIPFLVLSFQIWGFIVLDKVKSWPKFSMRSY